MKRNILVSIVLLILLLISGCNSKVSNSPDFPKYLDDLFGGEWTTPGLVTVDGEKYELPENNKTTGSRINVLDYGAVADDESYDNSESFNLAIDAAQAGDEVYVPKGTYYFQEPVFFSTKYVAHISLKSNVNFAGDGIGETILVSQFTPSMNEKYNTTVVLVNTQSEITISDMTITSNTADDMLPNPDISNQNTFVETSPVYGIAIDSEKPNEIHGSIHIENILVEKFQRMGIRIRWVHDVRVRGCTIQKATDLGGGGAGYGICIQGMANGVDITDSNVDTLHNVVENCQIIGPYIRHGIIIQYYAHNNLITNNTITDTLLDAIDLHGEDEYSNEISYNTITNTRNGAGIGVGNSGATHDASGPYNYIHHNEIVGCKRGIDILYGSQNTVVINNVIKDIETDNTTGLLIQNGNHSYVRGNEFLNITGMGVYGIKVLYSYNALEPANGMPSGIKIVKNSFENITQGVFIECHDSNYIYESNKYKNIALSEYTDANSEFILPEVSGIVTPRSGVIIYPTDDNFITNEYRDKVQNQSNMKFKSSYFDVPYNRMLYIKFDLSDIPTNKDYIYLRLTGKSKDGLMNVNIHGTTEYIDWSEDKITWENAEYHEDQVAAVLDKNNELTLVSSFQFVDASYTFSTYYIDITEYIQDLDSDVVTLILSNDAVEDMYCEIYSKEISNDDYKMALVFSNDE